MPRMPSFGPKTALQQYQDEDSCAKQIAYKNAGIVHVLRGKRLLVALLAGWRETYVTSTTKMTRSDARIPRP